MSGGYDIAVKISLIENVTRGLSAMSSAFGRTGQDAAKLEATLARIGKMTLAGGLLAGAGMMGLGGLDATVEAASKYQKAVADFKTLNLSAHENGEMEAKAAEIAHKNLGSTLTGNVKLIQDLHTAFGDLHHAIDTSEDFAKYETVIKQAFGEQKADGIVNAAAKALEHRGDKVLGNSAEFQKELQAMSRVELATKGRVSAKDYLAASQTGKMAYMNLDSDYLYGKGAAMMTTMNGGDKYGTMLMTTYSSLVGGHMDKKAKNFLSEIGMYQEAMSPERTKAIKAQMKGMDAQEKQIFMQQLGGESMLSGGLKSEYTDLMKSPDKLAATMAEKIRERYGQNMSNEDVAQMIGQNFNRNTGAFLGQHLMNTNKFEKDANVFNKAMDYNQGYDNYMGTQAGSSQAMHAQWENLKTVMGQGLLPVVQAITGAMTGMLAGLTQFTQAHPKITQFIMILLGVVAVIAVVAGVVLLATVAFTALGAVLGFISLPVLAIIAVVAVVIALGVYLYSNWGAIKAKLIALWNSMTSYLSGVWGRIKANAMSAWNGFVSALSLIWKGIVAVCRAIWSGLSSFFMGLWTSIKANAMSAWNGFKSALSLIWNGIKATGLAVWNSIKAVLVAVWNSIKAVAMAVWNAIKAFLVGAWNAIANTIRSAVASAQSAVSSGFSAIYNAIVSWIQKAVAAVQGVMGSIGSGISDLYARAKSAIGIDSVRSGGGMSASNVSLHMDGRQVAHGVIRHMTASANRPNMGGNRFDGARGGFRVGMA